MCTLLSGSRGEDLCCSISWTCCLDGFLICAVLFSPEEKMGVFCYSWWQYYLLGELWSLVWVVLPGSSTDPSAFWHRLLSFHCWPLGLLNADPWNRLAWGIAMGSSSPAGLMQDISMRFRMLAGSFGSLCMNRFPARFLLDDYQKIYYNVSFFVFLSLPIVSTAAFRKFFMVDNHYKFLKFP